jgi:hypothetical protein
MNCLTSKQNPIRWELCSNPMHALKKKVWEMYASKQNPIRWELCSNPMHALKKKVWEMYAPTPTSPPPFSIPFNGVHQQVWLSLLQGVPLHGVFCWGSITRVGWLSNIHTYSINQGTSLLLVDCCNVCRHILASPLL